MSQQSPQAQASDTMRLDIHHFGPRHTQRRKEASVGGERGDGLHHPWEGAVGDAQHVGKAIIIIIIVTLV